MAKPNGPDTPAIVNPNHAMARADRAEPTSSTTCCSVTFLGRTGRSADGSVGTPGAEPSAGGGTD